MNVACRLVEILEKSGITHIFGIPGEQIMPMYDALSESEITHILTRHEQAAAHAADGFTRSSEGIGVCMATAGPGALNLVMGVACAFKDSIPMLVLTGDNDSSKNGVFQSMPLRDIFSNITYKSYSPLNGTEAVYMLKAAIHELKNNPIGPVHVNLAKNILLSEDFEDFDLCYMCENDLSGLDDAKKLISGADKPLFVLGAGAISQRDRILKIADKYRIPITTTYNARGIISEDNPLNLGLLGVRATPRAKKAIEKCDCIIALGSIAGERTFPDLREDIFIHVNINKEVLKGKHSIHASVGDFLDKVEFKKTDFLDELIKIDNAIEVEGINDEFKPQAAIKRILECFSDDIIVSDAGSHTTFAMLLYHAKYPNHLLFPAAMAPMGYGLPAGIGSAIASGERVVVINGDGDFQMNLQEMTTLKENNLNVIVFILNNSEYGIIRQWEEQFYDMDPYQVSLENPDFLKLAASYGIDAVRINTLFDLEYFLEKDLTGPLIVEVNVDSEDIPLPE